MLVGLFSWCLELEGWKQMTLMIVEVVEGLKLKGERCALMCNVNAIRPEKKKYPTHFAVSHHLRCSEELDAHGVMWAFPRMFLALFC
jgi:hypothetical protein